MGKTEKKCNTCRLDQDKIDEWDTNHRGSTLVKMFEGQSLYDILKAKKWNFKTRESSSNKGRLKEFKKKYEKKFQKNKMLFNRSLSAPVAPSIRPIRDVTAAILARELKRPKKSSDTTA